MITLKSLAPTHEQWPPVISKAELTCKDVPVDYSMGYSILVHYRYGEKQREWLEQQTPGWQFVLVERCGGASELANGEITAPAHTYWFIRFATNEHAVLYKLRWM
jgi:hypothetical protein